MVSGGARGMQGHMRMNHPTKDFKCPVCHKVRLVIYDQTLQELQILSSVTLNYQVTKIVMDSGS